MMMATSMRATTTPIRAPKRGVICNSTGVAAEIKLVCIECYLSKSLFESVFNFVVGVWKEYFYWLLSPVALESMYIR